MSFSFVFQTLGTASVTFRSGKTRAFENGRGPGESLDLLHCRETKMPLCIHYRTTNNGKGHDSLKACYSESLTLYDLRLGVGEKAQTLSTWSSFYPLPPLHPPSFLHQIERIAISSTSHPQACLKENSLSCHSSRTQVDDIRPKFYKRTHTLSRSLFLCLSLSHTHTQTKTRTRARARTYTNTHMLTRQCVCLCVSV